MQNSFMNMREVENMAAGPLCLQNSQESLKCVVPFNFPGINNIYIYWIL